MPRNPDRTTVPPTPPDRREERARVVTRPSLPERGTSEESEREVFMRALASIEAKVDAKISAAQRSTEPPKKSWKDLATQFIAALSLIGGVIANIKPTTDARLDPAYEKLAAAVTTMDTRQQRTDASVEGLRAWLAGYFAVTGVKVVDPPGTPAPLRVELQPAPLQSDDTVRPGAAPAVQVRTPLPAPPPSAKPIQLAPRLE